MGKITVCGGQRSHIPSAVRCIAALFEELKHKPFYYQGYYYLGELCSNTGRKERALEYLSKAGGMFKEIGMNFWLAKTEDIMGGS